MCIPPIMPIQQHVADQLFLRGGYVKKLIEDCNNSDETTKLLKVAVSVFSQSKTFPKDSR